MRRDGAPSWLAHAVEGVPRVSGEPEERVGNAQAEKVSLVRRDLGPHEHEDALVVPLGRLGVEVAVIGDDDEAETGPSRRGDDLLRVSSSVRERRVDMDDS